MLSLCILAVQVFGFSRAITLIGDSRTFHVSYSFQRESENASGRKKTNLSG
jgi:hypothetical protein